MNRPLVIAHRGASGERPENTLSAYELAIAQSADMIEIDLHLSLDGVIMIHHDANLERLGASGAIRDHTAGELSRLNAAPGASLEERIPTLLDVLDRFGERMEFNLEIKVGEDTAYEGIEEIALAAVVERGLLPRMLFSSFYDGVLRRMRALSSAARLALLVSPKAPVRIMQRAAAVSAEAINPEVRLVDAKMVAKAHDSGLAVYPYTEDDPAGMVRLLDAGVDGIITNHPARLRALLEDRGGA
jgi:glycerophosphoryl diester phosphodiesterase